METFYDVNGTPIAYVEWDEKKQQDGTEGLVYLFTGEPVAWISGENIFAYSGRFLGWIINGWVLDRTGASVFFTENAGGGMVKPVRSIRPVRSVKHVRPVRGVKEVKPVRPVKQLSWSKLSGLAFWGFN